MHGKAFTLLLAIAMSFSVSMRSNGEEIRVQTGRININHRQNGDTYIDTGKMQISVPSHRSRSQNYSPDNSSDQSTFQGCRGGNVVHQYNQQINQSNRTSSHSSTSHYRCH